MDPLPLEALPPLPSLPTGVVGHVECVSFLNVERLPVAGEILHTRGSFEHAAGGGAVVAVQLARLTGLRVPFFTALGRDRAGEQALEELQALGLEVHVAWRSAPTRRCVTFVDGQGERTIVVIGERLHPVAADPLPWDRFTTLAGTFVTATDAGGLQAARRAGLLAVTPRVGLAVLRDAAVELDAVIGSATDPGERFEPGDLVPEPRITLATEGARGGVLRAGSQRPEQRFGALQRFAPVVDAYGAGDCFAAGTTLALAAGWSLPEAISLGCHCGSSCLDGAGPYEGQLRRIGPEGRVGVS